MKFEIGQLVYYKRDKFKEWKGPGKIIGIDGETIIVNTVDLLFEFILVGWRILNS